MLGKIHHPDLVPDAIAREVDDDVVPFGDAQLVQFCQRHRIGQQIAIVGNLDHRRGITQRDREEARDSGVEQAEAVLASLHLEEGLVGAVDHDRVAQKAVRLEDVERQLSRRIPGLVRQREVDVVVEVAPRLGRATRQSEIDAVVDRLVATILCAVQVHRRGQTLVHALGGEAEHVVVEPVAAHCLVPVARNLDDAAVVIRAAGVGIGRRRVDRAESGQHHGPVVVVELTGEEESPGEAVVLRPVVGVVLVGRSRVPAESTILGDAEWQAVVVTEQNRLAVADLSELGWERAVERPYSERPLVREVRVEARRYRGRGVDARIQARRNARIVGGVASGTELRNLDGDLGGKVVEALMRPDRSRRTALDRAGIAGFDALQRWIQHLLGGICLRRGRWIQRRDRVPRQNIQASHRLRERLHPEQRAGRQAGRNAGSVGALRERADAVLEDDGAGCSEQSQLDEVSA